MTDISTIFHAAYGKDAVGLKAAVDAVMTDKVSSAVSDISADVAASLFGSTSAFEEDEVEESSEQETQEDQTQEEQSDEAV